MNARPSYRQKVSEPDRIDIARLEHLARGTAARPADPLLVSIDFDFFLRLPTASDLPNDVRDAAIVALDWIGDERTGAEMAHRQWSERAQALTMLGLDPRAVIGIDRATTPDDLLRALRDRVALPMTCQAADSHAWGMLAVLRSIQAAGGPIQVLSFDAHHDLGYLNDDADTPARSRARRRTSVSADDWLAAAISRGWVSHATIVYPDWLGLFEWQHEAPTLGVAPLRRVRALTFRQWCALGDAAMVAAGLIAVRSSEWVPPWGGHDDAFLDLVASLAPQTEWLDNIMPGVRVGPHSAATPRREVI